MNDVLSISPGPSLESAPFDPALAVLHGQLVEAVYSMYDADPDNLRPDPTPDFPKSFRLAAWITMRDFVFESTGPTFYGVVAQDKSNPNQFLLAIRGTSTWIEWWDDLNAIVLVPFKDGSKGLVGAGFARIYETLAVELAPRADLAGSISPHSLAAVGGFSDQVAAVIEHHALGARPRISAAPSLAVAAHSLGAALATLFVQDNADSTRLPISSIYTFASPRVGDATFAETFDALRLTSWRIDNLPDLVPYLPLGFTHVQKLKQYDSAFAVWPSPACWHSLKTYLSLIDPRLKPASDCQVTLAEQAHAARATASATTSIPGSSGPVTVNINVNLAGGE